MKYFIGLEPEQDFCNQINKQKQFIREIAGEQIYLQEPPHITLFVFTSENEQELIKEIENLAKQISKFGISLGDFQVFYNDLQTNANTITYLFSEKDTENLKKLQVKIIESIANLNTKQLFQKNSEVFEKMSEIEKLNIEKYGFPFINENFIPHITLASIEPEKFNQVFENLKQEKEKMQTQFSIKSINLYKILDKSALIKEFELK